MKILVLNGSYRPEGTTTELARSFMAGAQAAGAQAQMIMLRDRRIGYCTNCLQCYGFPGEGIAPCSLKDDMDELIPRIAEADGVLFASPVHNGFVTGLMAVFWERLSWRAARPAGSFLRSMGIASRLQDKVRAFGAISSAGGFSERLRRFCDDGTPWLKSNAPLILHGQWVGDMYAGAELERMPQTGPDWTRIFFLRRLSAGQRERARGLGAAMAEAIKSGRLKPTTIATILPPPLRWAMDLVAALRPPYRVAR